MPRVSGPLVAGISQSERGGDPSIQTEPNYTYIEEKEVFDQKSDKSVHQPIDTIYSDIPHI